MGGLPIEDLTLTVVHLPHDRRAALVGVNQAHIESSKTPQIVREVQGKEGKERTLTTPKWVESKGLQ